MKCDCALCRWTGRILLLALSQIPFVVVLLMLGSDPPTMLLTDGRWVTCPRSTFIEHVIGDSNRAPDARTRYLLCDGALYPEQNVRSVLHHGWRSRMH